MQELDLILNADQIKGAVRCSCETKNGGFANNGLICETNGTTEKIAECRPDEWCTSNSWHPYSTRLRPNCEKGKLFKNHFCKQLYS